MIVLDNIDFSYNSREKIISNASVTFENGKIYAVIGKSGSGKSTLLKLLNGLLKPQKGTVTVDGIDTSLKKADMKQIRSSVGLVLQYPEHQLFAETVFDDIAFGPKNLGFGEAEIEKCVKTAMASVGLTEEMYKASPFELSGGERRLAAIAGVLAMKPNTLVLDEPTVGLSAAAIKKLYKAIKAFGKNKTVIIASHSMEIAAEIADELIVLSEGKIIMSGTPSEIFSDTEGISDTGLVLPPMAELTFNLKKRGLNVETAYTLDGAEKNIVKLLCDKK